VANPLLMAEIFDNINEGIYILNRKGDYIYCNNAFLKMVGATREEALRLNAFQLIPEGQVSVSVAVTAFTEKKKVSVVNNVLTPKGYHYRQLATATPIFGSGGEVEYMLVETVRLDLLAKRYQQAILYEDDSTIEVPALSPERTRAKETIIADSPAMQAILQTAAQVAQTDSTVLISGETGTGKEVLAKYIHRNSSRADAPIIEINCAALPENLLEAELFGYTKGAFTGALNTGKPGLIEAAHGGTLFLDEINSLPLALQGIQRDERSERALAVLERVGLSDRANHRPHQLSGGEQQRVAIARALINRPEILLADEPTGNLDPHNAMEIMGLLEKINRRGTTVIVVTHSHEIVDMMKKRVITIDRGMVIRDEEESGYRYED